MVVIFVKKSSGLSDSILNGEYHSLNHFSDDFASFGEVSFDGNGGMTYQQLQSSSNSLDAGSGMYSVSSDGQINIGDNRGVVSTDGKFVFIVHLGNNPGIENFAKKFDSDAGGNDQTVSKQGFDYLAYLAANPDLPLDWGIEECMNHYNMYGKFEKRLLAFDAQEYLSLYPDLPQGLSKQHSIFIIVVFPAPLGPKREKS